MGGLLFYTFIVLPATSGDDHLSYLATVSSLVISTNRPDFPFLSVNGGDRCMQASLRTKGIWLLKKAYEIIEGKGFLQDS